EDFWGGPPRPFLMNCNTTEILRQIRAVKRIGEYHRDYSHNPSQRATELIEHYIRVVRKYNEVSVPLPYSPQDTQQWLEREGKCLLEQLRKQTLTEASSVQAKYQSLENELFKDCSSRSKWLEIVGLGKVKNPPPRTITCTTTNKLVRDPAEIK